VRACFYFVLFASHPKYSLCGVQLSALVQLRSLNVLGSAVIGLIFTGSRLGWPKPANKWDIQYHVMSCSVFKGGSWLEQGYLLLGSVLSIRWWENCTLFILLTRILAVVCFSLCCSVKPFSSQPMSFCLFLLILFPSPLGRGEEWESDCVVLCCRLGLNHNISDTHLQFLLSPPPAVKEHHCFHSAVVPTSLPDLVEKGVSGASAVEACQS